MAPDVLHNEIILLLNPQLVTELHTYDSLKKTALLNELTNKLSPEDLKEIVSQALKKTPYYKTLERLGFKNLTNLDFSDLHAVSLDLSKP